MPLVLNCWENANSGGTAVTSLNVNKPTSGSVDGDSPKNAVSGDLLVIIVGNDDGSDVAQWNDSTLKPTGFTLINEAGAAAYALHCAAFYRVVDGTEGATFNIPAESSDEMWASCILLSGQHATTPLNVVGADSLDNTPIPIIITEVITTADNCLAFYAAGFDGADAGGFALVGTGWAERQEVYSGTAPASACGTWGTKVVTPAGASGEVQLTPTVQDGMAGFQFAIAPAAAGSSAALTGTLADGATETELRTGGLTYIYELTGTTFVDPFNDTIRGDIRSGIVSAQAEAAGFNARRNTIIQLADIVRTGPTTCTVTTSADSGYYITQNEVLTGTLPASATVAAVPIEATPTATITPNPPNLVSILPTSGSPDGGTSVTLTGTDFKPGITVAFGANPATSVVRVSDTEVTCVTPAYTG